MYYIDTLHNELTTTKAYVEYKVSKTVIISDHSKTLHNFKLPITKAELPTMYWLPKLHKTPYKSRFIANSSNCTLKTLSVHLTSALIRQSHIPDFTAVLDRTIPD